MDQLSQAFYTFKDEFESKKSKIPDNQLQKLQFLLKSIELQGINSLEIDPSLFPDITEDELQTIFNLPLIAQQSMFITLMKSYDLEQNEQFIEGELEIKTELYNQWKTQKLKLSLGSKELTYNKSDKQIVLIKLINYQVVWEGKYFGFSKKYGFKINSTVHNKVDHQYKQLYFGSDDQKYALEWFGYFQMIYKGKSNQDNQKVTIIKRRESIGGIVSSSKENEINMSLSNDFQFEKKSISLHHQSQVKARSQSISLPSLAAPITVAEQKMEKPIKSDDTIIEQFELDNSNDLFSCEGSNVLQVEKQIKDQEKSFESQENLDTKQEEENQATSFEQDQDTNDYMPYHLRDYFNNKKQNIIELLNLNGFIIHENNDQFRVYVDRDDQKRFKGHFNCKQQFQTNFSKPLQKIIHDSHILNNSNMQQIQKIIPFSKIGSATQGQFKNIQWVLEECEQSRIKYQTVVASFIEESTIKNQVVQLIYCVVIGYFEDTLLFQLSRCFYLFREYFVQLLTNFFKKYQQLIVCV